MAWPKGKPRPPGAGRAKGTPNRSTEQVRQTIAAFANGSVHKLEEKFAEIDDPGRWIDLWARVVEYHIPKLGRTELTGADGEKLSVSVQINRTVKDKE